MAFVVGWQSFMKTQSTGKKNNLQCFTPNLNVGRYLQLWINWEVSQNTGDDKVIWFPVNIYPNGRT